jgi:hypothetical protein
MEPSEYMAKFDLTHVLVRITHTTYLKVFDDQVKAHCTSPRIHLINCAALFRMKSRG